MSQTLPNMLENTVAKYSEKMYDAAKKDGVL